MPRAHGRGHDTFHRLHLARGDRGQCEGIHKSAAIPTHYHTATADKVSTISSTATSRHVDLAGDGSHGDQS